MRDTHKPFPKIRFYVSYVYLVLSAFTCPIRPPLGLHHTLTVYISILMPSKIRKVLDDSIKKRKFFILIHLKRRVKCKCTFGGSNALIKMEEDQQVQR